MATQSSVAATLRKQGFAMTLTHIENVDYDPVAGSYPEAEPPNPVTVYGIVKPFGVMTVAFASTLGDSLIKAGDQQAIIEGTVAPVVGDTMQVMSETWSVVNFDRIYPQGETLLYKVHLRR